MKNVHEQKFKQVARREEKNNNNNKISSHLVLGDIRLKSNLKNELQKRIKRL